LSYPFLIGLIISRLGKTIKLKGCFMWADSCSARAEQTVPPALLLRGAFIGVPLCVGHSLFFTTFKRRRNCMDRNRKVSKRTTARTPFS
jgi:hypothetical protein